VAAFETAKKNPGNRRMATVASVYTVDPHIRTAEEITEALFRDEADPDASKPSRPEPANKATTAHMPEMVDDGDGSDLRISGIHVAMAWMIGQITQRRRPGQVLIVLMDGQESLWETMKLHLSFGPRTVPILDIVHALDKRFSIRAVSCCRPRQPLWIGERKKNQPADGGKGMRAALRFR